MMEHRGEEEERSEEAYSGSGIARSERWRAAIRARWEEERAEHE